METHAKHLPSQSSRSQVSVSSIGKTDASQNGTKNIVGWDVPLYVPQ